LQAFDFETVRVPQSSRILVRSPVSNVVIVADFLWFGFITVDDCFSIFKISNDFVHAT